MKNSIPLIIMIIISCVTQILTLMKSSMVAGLFGTSVEMDAFNFANSIISFIFGFVASGISTVIIPNYIHKKDDTKSVNAFITLLYFGIFIIVVSVILFRIQLVSSISGREDVFVSITSSILLILLFVNFFHSITDVTTAYFQCNGNYNIPKIINLISQVFVIIMLLLCKDITIMKYTYIISLGVLVNFIFDVLIAIIKGWRYIPNFNFLDKEVIKQVKIFMPIVLSSGIYKLSLMVDSSIASRLETGKVSILSYSGQISGMLNTILIGNLLIYIYPQIVKRINIKDNQRKFWNITILFHCIVCYLIVAFASVGLEGIEFLFQRGKFNAEDSMKVFIGAMIYIFGQQTNIVRDLIYRYFYAKGDTKTAAKNSVFVSVVNISASILLVYFIGFYGIIIGTVIASFASLVLIMFHFNKKIGIEVHIKWLLQSYLKNIIISAIVVAIIWFIKKFIFVKYSLLAIIIYGLLSILIYSILTILFNKQIIETLKEI